MAAKTLTFTGGTGVTSVTPRFDFTSGTAVASVNGTLVHTFTSGVEANIALTVGQTLTYDFSNWDAVTRIDINGDKVAGGMNSSDLPSGLAHYDISGCTLLTGVQNSSDLPSGLGYYYIGGCPLLTGVQNSSDLPSGLARYYIYGCTLLTGVQNSSDLPSGLAHYYIGGCPLLTGVHNSSDFQSGVRYYYINSCPLLTGDLSGGTSFAGLRDLYAYGTKCTYGTGQSLKYCDSSLIKIDLDDCSLTWPEVNRVLADLVASGVAGKVLDIAGTNSGPTTTGAADAATLVSRGWTISINAVTPFVSRSRLHTGIREDRLQP